MFIDLTKEIFSFLVQKYGFLEKEETPSSIVYESKNIVFSVFYDNQRSFEVDAGIRKKNSEEPLYSFGEIIRALNVPTNEWPSGYSAKNDNEVEARLQLICKVLYNYGKELLIGEKNTWRILEKQREADCIEYAKKSK